MEGFKGVKHYIFILFICIIFCIIYSYHSNVIVPYSVSIIPIIKSIPSSTLYAITGNMLGDGSISLSKLIKVKVNIP